MSHLDVIKIGASKYFYFMASHTYPKIEQVVILIIFAKP
jgi:hypothetical protein